MMGNRFDFVSIIGRKKLTIIRLSASRRLSGALYISASISKSTKKEHTTRTQRRFGIGFRRSYVNRSILFSNRKIPECVLRCVKGTMSRSDYFLKKNIQSTYLPWKLLLLITRGRFSFLSNSSLAVYVLKL